MLILFTFAALAGGVHMEAGMWLDLIVPSVARRAALHRAGLRRRLPGQPQRGGADHLNIVFLILSFASGLFLPVSMLPPFVQQLAPYLPTNRFGQLVWNAVGAQTHDSLGSNVLWLGGYGLVFVVIAVRAYGREEKKSFG